MIVVVGDIRKVDDTFFVTVRGERGIVNPFWMPSHDDENPYMPADPAGGVRRSFVLDWITANCKGTACTFGSAAVRFFDEEDALLFWMTFK